MGPVPQAGHRDGHHQVREVGWPAGRRAGGLGDRTAPISTRSRCSRLPRSGSGATLLSTDKQADVFFRLAPERIKKKKKTKHPSIEIKRKHAPKE